MKHSISSSNLLNILRTCGPALAIIAATGFSGGANAMQIDSGNRDLGISWDNTLRYTAGWRMQSPDSRIINNPDSDEFDSKFKKGDMVANGVDLFSELDVV